MLLCPRRRCVPQTARLLPAAKAVLGRMDIRSPYSGEVVGLNVFSVGSVMAAPSPHSMPRQATYPLDHVGRYFPSSPSMPMSIGNFVSNLNEKDNGTSRRPAGRGISDPI